MISSRMVKIELAWCFFLVYWSRDSNQNKGKFILNSKSQEIKSSVTCVFTMTITHVITANTKSVAVTKMRKQWPGLMKLDTSKIPPIREINIRSIAVCKRC